MSNTEDLPVAAPASDVPLSSDDASASDPEADMLEIDALGRKMRPAITPSYDSDSSTDLPTFNTVGSIPMEWYDDMPHIGYSQSGQRILKSDVAAGGSKDVLDAFLDAADNPDAWRTVRDDLMQRNIVLSDADLDMIRRVREQRYPDAEYDPYTPAVDFFTKDVMVTPLTAMPEPKRRFLPSKHEAKRVMRMVRAIRQGRMHAQTKKVVPEEDSFRDLWADDGDDEEAGRVRGPQKIPAPKAPLPGHRESYNPPVEYLPKPKDLVRWKRMKKAEKFKRPAPERYTTMRHIPAFDGFVYERFQRSLDLYLCPRVRKNRLNIDPESLLPKLPDAKELEPYPKHLAVTYRGHVARVRTCAVDPTGLWIVSGADDGEVRLWMLSTGRCVQQWSFKRATAVSSKAADEDDDDTGPDNVVYNVAWNPADELCLFSVAVGERVILVSPKSICDATTQRASLEAVESGFAVDKSADQKPLIRWSKPSAAEAAQDILAIIPHSRSVKHLSWHRKGDYFATTCPEAPSVTVLVHQLSKHQTQAPFRKLQGQVQKVHFHPVKPAIFIATQRYVRMYDLQRQELVKVLQPGVKWISSMAVHPMGDNVIIGSYDKRVCWFDMDLAVKPYRTLAFHKQAVRDVSFHRRLPLFATASDDGLVQVFHGQVYNDLLQNALIVPVKILRGHEQRNKVGVLACDFHPTQPWLVSSGADSTLRLWC